MVNSRFTGLARSKGETQMTTKKYSNHLTTLNFQLSSEDLVRHWDATISMHFKLVHAHGAGFSAGRLFAAREAEYDRAERGARPAATETVEQAVTRAREDAVFAR